MREPARAAAAERDAHRRPREEARESLIVLAVAAAHVMVHLHLPAVEPLARTRRTLSLRRMDEHQPLGNRSHLAFAIEQRLELSQRGLRVVRAEDDHLLALPDAALRPVG